MSTNKLMTLIVAATIASAGLLHMLITGSNNGLTVFYFGLIFMAITFFRRQS